ncbi:unnamed protein product, partial [marine sediment metagenome]
WRFPGRRASFSSASFGTSVTPHSAVIARFKRAIQYAVTLVVYF